MKVFTLQVNNVLVVFTFTAKYCTFNYVRGDWGNNHWVGIQTQWAHSYLDFSHNSILFYGVHWLPFQKGAVLMFWISRYQ